MYFSHGIVQGLQHRHLVALLVLCSGIVLGQQPYHAGIPPWQNFENSVVALTVYGYVKGFSIPWTIYDEYWNPDWDEVPPWYARRINCFLGVPYALPPLGPLRFRRPLRPRWSRTWDATYFRHACPQRIDEIRKDIPEYPRRNISEDCLYLNIYAPNITYHPRGTKYPVMVWFHGGDWTWGSAQTHPGNNLGTREMVVVTVNYRLGALGFLSTEDEYGQGNWGLFDQHLALEFVKENIKVFNGDPDKITIAGEGAGGASVGFHMISPVTSKRGFFHQAIAMSGTDLDTFAFLDPYWRPREYAEEFAKMLRCPTQDSYLMLECLRNNKTITWQAMLSAQEQVKPKDGSIGCVWAPTQDGGYPNTWAFLPFTPRDIRMQQKFEKIPLIVGINTNDGARRANETVRNMERGMFKQTFKNKVMEFLKDFRVMDLYLGRAFEAVEFQYTWWPDPENNTARALEYVNLLTDNMFGMGMDEMLRAQADDENTWMYVFNYRSFDSYLPGWMGISDGEASRYVFGYPFYNETILNETELVARQWYDVRDRNISDFMVTMFSNFVKLGDPTPNITRNISWPMFNNYNLSYLVVEEYSYARWRYRQAKYGFWREYFPSIARRDYLYPTATPTPAGYEYIVATGCMSAFVVLLFLGCGVIGWLFVTQTRQLRYREAYADKDLPLSFSNTQISVSSGRSRTPTPTPHVPYSRSTTC